VTAEVGATPENHEQMQPVLSENSAGAIVCVFEVNSPLGGSWSDGFAF